MTESPRGSFGLGGLVVMGLIIVATVASALVLGGNGIVGNIRLTPTAVPAAELLARRAIEMNVIPRISDSQLAEVLDAVMKRAKSGDVDAAAFVLDVAQRQRNLKPDSASVAPKSGDEATITERPAS
ncbi:MAG: hypothetical protein L6Q92_15020 [Phycisphaerae bacterium]|nr:hypothetical protein [Phycisphaerae bacterium]